MDAVKIIAILIGITGSYLSFFNPALLSENIKELQSEKAKWIWSFGSVFVVVGGFEYAFVQSEIEWAYWLFVVILFFISCIDAYSFIIPNKLMLFGVLVTAIDWAKSGSFENIFSFLIISGLSIILYLIFQKVSDKKVIGLGDIKLISLLSLFSGWDIVLIIYIAIIVGGVFSISGIIFGKLKRTSRISFAPFLLIGFLTKKLAIEAYYLLFL